VFVVGVFLSNFPEALASAATMKQVVVSGSGPVSLR
jgi:hypothetical protein